MFNYFIPEIFVVI